MISRRKFLATAAAAIAGALVAGIVEAEKPVPAEDIQAVPLEKPRNSGVSWGPLADEMLERGCGTACPSWGICNRYARYEDLACYEQAEIWSYSPET